MVNDPRVAIVVLNWQGWPDTVECLESLQRLDYPDFTVVVVDNGSGDDSVAMIRSWAEGRVPVRSPFLDYDPSRKPLHCVRYGREQAEAGGEEGAEATLRQHAPWQRLVVIENGANLGFAGGNNVGLRYALARGDFAYVWLLNNDTVVRSDSLRHLVRQMQEEPTAGMCGSTLLYYHQPQFVQALGGGSFNRWTAFSRHLGAFRPADQPVDARAVLAEMDYVLGASMLLSQAFLRDVGLMSEDYFLYFEELDWAMRAGSRYRLAWAPGSIVYHKEGASIGSGNKHRHSSLLSDCYFIRNRLFFTRRYFPYALPTVYLAVMGALFNRVRRGQWDRIRFITRILLDGGRQLPDFVRPPAPSGAAGSAP